jgi:fructokinase
MPTEQIPPEHESWEFETEYIAFALANIVCIISPERLILGGGVSKAGKLGSERFFKMIRVKVKETLNGYIVSPELNEEIDRYIVPPYLVDDAGICGAIALAHQALAST